MSFLCSCFKSTSTHGDRMDQRQESMGVSLTEFEDLTKNPTQVNDNLEDSVANWEKAINTYREYEMSVLDDMSANPHADLLLSVLEKLRDLPEQYVEFTEVDVRELARLRCEIYRWQVQLGLPRESHNGNVTTKTTTMSTTDSGPKDDNSDDEQNAGGREATREASSGISMSDRAVNPMHDSLPNSPLATDRHTELLRRVESLQADPLVHRSLTTLQRLSSNPEYEKNKGSAMQQYGYRPGHGHGLGGESGVSQLQMQMKTPKSGTTPANPTLKANMKADNITSKLSITWAGRLDKVDLTQGGLVGAAGADGSLPHANAAVKVKPKWPHFLLDIWFDVIKWNNMGRKQRRLLKLTEYHVLNIKSGNEISKLYWYVDISRIWLENSNTLMFVMKGKSEPICYISPMAPSIVQQITTRVQVRIALEKTVFTAARTLDAQFMKPEFSHMQAESMIEAIQAEIGTDAVMADFAHGLVDKISKNRPVSSSYNESPSNTKAAKNKSPNLFVFSEGSLENLVQKEVQRVIFDAKTDEGNTRQVFLDTFDDSRRPTPKRSLTRVQKIEPPKPKKTLLDVRHFIDGLHEYYLSARGMEMTIIMLAWVKEKERADEAAGIVASKEERSSVSPTQADGGGSRVSRGSMRMSRAQRPSIANRNTSARMSVSNTRGSIRGMKYTDSLADLSDEQLAALSFISFTVIEEAVFLPLHDDIMKLLPSYNSTRDEDIVCKMQKLYKRSQAQWGVPADFISPLNWQTASFELAGLERAPTPSMQLMALARACKAIMAEFKNAVLPEIKKKGGKDTYLSADNLVPIFVYVFCRSNMKSPNLYKEIMWTLCHPDQLHGECGYYLTVFESAIEFVDVEPIDEIPGQDLDSDKQKANNKILSRLDDMADEDEFDDFDSEIVSPAGPAAKFGGVTGDISGSADGAPAKASTLTPGLSPAAGGGSAKLRPEETRTRTNSRRLTVKETLKIGIGLSTTPSQTMHKSFEESF